MGGGTFRLTMEFGGGGGGRRGTHCVWTMLCPPKPLCSPNFPQPMILYVLYVSHPTPPRPSGTTPLAGAAAPPRGSPVPSMQGLLQPVMSQQRVMSQPWKLGHYALIMWYYALII